MIIDRSAVKRTAKQAIRFFKPKIIYATALYVALSAVLGYLANQVVSPSAAQIAEYYRLLGEQQVYSAATQLARSMSSPTGNLISMALSLVGIILGAGYTAYIFNTLRFQDPDYSSLLDGFGPYFRLAVLNLVTSIFVWLWSLLLIIPGIIAAYRYILAPYILLENPDWSIMDCIRASKERTYGHKTEFFVLTMSFFGWALLSLVPLLGIVVRIWLLPYIQICLVFYYDIVSGRGLDEAQFDIPHIYP